MSQTYVKGTIVNAGEAYHLRGTVLGPVEVRAGGELINEGCVTEQLYVCVTAEQVDDLHDRFPHEFSARTRDLRS